MQTQTGTRQLSRTLAAEVGLPQWLPALLCIFCLCVAGCSHDNAAERVLASRCLPVGGSQDARISIVSLDPGSLFVRINERGVSVIASFDGDPPSAASSPLERFGTISLVTKTERGLRHQLTIHADDSPEITGTVCYEASHYSNADNKRLAAEMSFAAAGRAVHATDWVTAFHAYLDSARRFDHLHLWVQSGAARHALAELAYRRLDKKRDSYAMANEAIADYERGWSLRAAPEDGHHQLYLGLLVLLESKALLEMPGVDVRHVAPRVRELQATARKYFLHDPIGAREVARVDIMRGFLEYQLDAFADARRLFAAAAASCRSERDWECYAKASQNLALLNAEGRNYTDALATLADALNSLPRGLYPKLAADIWSNYGILQGLAGLLSGSEHAHAMAMREYAEIGDCQGVRRNLARSGSLLVQLGNLSDAMSDLQQAASYDCASLLANATGTTPKDPAQELRPDGSPAHRPVSTADAAPPAWCSQAIDPTDLATENKLIVFDSLVSLGNALMLQGEPKLARRCVDGSEPYATTAQSRIRLADARGEVLLENRDAAGARTAFQKAIWIGEEARVPAAYEFRSLAQLGAVKAALLAGNFVSAVQEANPALKASVSRGDIDQTVTSLRLLAAGYRGTEQRDRAARTLRTAVDLIEAVPINELDGEKRATYLATQHDVFAELTDLYASAADTEPSMASLAFAASERGRARSLRYAVTQSERDATASLDSLPIARYQKLLGDVIALASTQDRSSAPDLVERLDAAALREQRPDEAVDLQQLIATLNQLQATLVEYAVGVRDTFAFVVNEHGLHVVRLGEHLKIATAAMELHDRLLDPEAPQDEVRAAARQLAELVLWPVRQELTGKRIIIVPDDGLHTVPFSVLPWSQSETDLLLLQHAEVSVVPSALFLARAQARDRGHVSTPRMELLGDPIFRIADWQQECMEAKHEQATSAVSRAVYDWTEKLPRLPGSRAEVQMVARLSQQYRPGSHVEMLLGCAAVATALRQAVAGQIDLLHIATHARVDSQRPRLSALALTPERSAHGMASAFGLLDILGLKLSSSLVVLSACETSRGRLLPGEGVLGPAQAFLQAGARGVVASYWRVDDLTTSKFMQVFYGYLLGEHLSAAAALRKAQLEQSRVSPIHDWAAFSLYGWPDSSI